MMGNFIKKLVSWKLTFAYLLIVVGLSFFTTSAAFNNNAGSGFGGATSNGQYYAPSFNQLYSSDVSTYWPIIGELDGEQCEATSDFAVMIPPGGCSPSIVRSDLLAEQNVPVFCQLQSVQLNPLIEVSSIKSISFKGDYPDGVSGISFHPARAATKSYRTLLGNPVINNIGYVVIIVKQNKIEDNLEEWIAGNLTASIRYDAEKAFGVGQADYYLPAMSDSNWEKDYVKNAFWKGKGYLRLADVNKNSATIQIYNNKDNVYRTMTLQEGQTSELTYFPGYYCMAGMKVKLHKVEAPEDSVLLNIDGQESWYRKGSKFLNGKCNVRSMDIKENSTGTVKISCPGQKNIELELARRDGTLVDTMDPDTDSDFSKSLDIVVNELVEDYSSVKKDAFLETYGEEALIEQIKIAKELGKEKTVETLLDLFLDTYPKSSSYDVKFRDKQKLGSYDYSSAYSNVLVTNELHSIGISEFNKIDKFSKNVTLRIGGKAGETHQEGDVISFGTDGELAIVKIDVDEIRLSFKSKDSKLKSDSIEIAEGERGTLGGRDILIKQIDLKELAYISLIPEVKNTKTEAEFTFRVGIEKRSIELNPEKTEEMLVNINASIDKWNGINERLGGVIKTWKAACLATSSYLMLKNVMSGFGGEGLARQKVMADYKIVCQNKVDNGDFVSRTACYNSLSSQIDSNVTAMTVALSDVNDEMEGVSSSGNYIEDGILGDKINNQEKYVDDLRVKLDSKYPNGGWKRTVNDQELNSGDLTTSSQIRAALLAEKFGDESVNGKIANTELDNILKSVASRNEAKSKTDALQGVYDYEKINFPASALSSGQGSVPDKKLLVSKSDLLETLSGKKDLVEKRLEGKENSYKVGVQIVQSDNAIDYLYLLEEDGRQLGIFEVKKSSETLEVLSAPDKLPISDGKSVRIVSGGECSNAWSSENAKVKFYQSGENKGLPAIVPFDLTDGWYAMVPNSQGTFLDDAPQGYKASGQVNYFKICNVGTNGLEEAGKKGDFCQSFSAASIGSVDKFPLCSGMTSAQVKNLYDRADSAIRQVSSQQNAKSWLIDGNRIGLGDPASFSGSLECQDFMSPDDCLLMFNTCDPVICPSSRCNLGGKMPVADVIQTGIVGSLMLCLPNAKEGIYVPICLSGVHAGIDAYVSILDSEKACLERSLETGEHVGICDEITSIYKCEFFWKQAAPITELAFQKLISGFTGSSSPDGGGEYLFVPSAFENLENSLDFFRNTYAPNAFKAFEARNVEEAGTEFCQAFIGTSFPTSADAFDSLLEPESPTQFFARFSEDILSDVTVPATSHYKVYYHIFAGNDKGVQYRVYLQDPPQSGYYSVNPTVSVKTGYIAQGETRDEAIDFTAPEGYKELCVAIDAETYCGFGSVTTDVGIKLVTESFVADQASQEDITTEKECVSGTPTLLNQADPDIISQGIVRICSNEIGETSRWRDVGYCGDENFRCYLDTESVLDNLKTLSAFGNYTINELGENKNLVDSLIKTNEEVRALLGTIEESISELQVGGFTDSETEEKVLSDLNGIIGVGGPGHGDNQAKARALFLKAKLYWGKIRLSLSGGSPKVETAPRETEIFGVLNSGDVLRNIETGEFYDVLVDDLEGDLITVTLTLRGGGETDWETFEKDMGELLSKEGFELFFGNLEIGENVGAESNSIQAEYSFINKNLEDINSGEYLIRILDSEVYAVETNTFSESGNAVLLLRNQEDFDDKPVLSALTGTKVKLKGYLVVEGDVEVLMEDKRDGFFDSVMNFFTEDVECDVEEFAVGEVCVPIEDSVSLEKTFGNLGVGEILKDSHPTYWIVVDNSFNLNSLEYIVQLSSLEGHGSQSITGLGGEKISKDYFWKVYIGDLVLNGATYGDIRYGDLIGHLGDEIIYRVTSTPILEDGTISFDYREVLNSENTGSFQNVLPNHELSYGFFKVSFL